MCVCVCFGVGPIILGFSRVCRGWLFGDNRLILLQTDGNQRDYQLQRCKLNLFRKNTVIYTESFPCWDKIHQILVVSKHKIQLQPYNSTQKSSFLIWLNY